MTDTALPLALTLSSGVERMFPTLTPAQIKRIAAHGQVRSIRPGEVLVEAGQQVVPFFVITAGRVEVIRPSGSIETLVAVHEPGQFTGEVNMLSGRPALVRSRERFLTSFYRALDFHFVAEEFIAAGDEVVALGRIEGKTRKAGAPIDVPFAHVWTVREGYLQRLRAFTDTAVLAHALEKG
jgi:hypothetical protein